MDENMKNDLYNCAMEINNQFIIDYVNEKYADEDQWSRTLRILSWQDKTEEDIRIMERNKAMDKICVVNQDKEDIYNEVIEKVNTIFERNRANDDFEMEHIPILGTGDKLASLLIHIECIQIEMLRDEVKMLHEISEITGAVSFSLNYTEDKLAINITLSDYFYDMTEYEGGN